MTGGVVVSRTAGRHWILAGVLLVVSSGFLWLALASTQQSPRVAGFVFGGAFGLLGLNLVLRSLKKPVINELVIDSTGISRVIGGVAWAVRWDELRAASVVTRKSDQVVLSPAVDRFDGLHRSLVRINGGDFLVAGIELYASETPRVLEALAKYVDVKHESVVDAPVSGPVRQTAPWTVPPVEMPAAVAIHVNGWDRVKLRWVQFFALMIELGLVDFLPADDDFPLDRPGLAHLRQGDAWYRLPCVLSATAAKEFEAHIRGVLPASVRLAGKPRQGRRRRRSLGGLRDRRRRPDALSGSRRSGQRHHVSAMTHQESGAGL